MKKHSLKWVCPFCLTSWLCDGPHIEPKDINSFSEYLYYAKEDHAYTCIDEIAKYEMEKGLDLGDLKEVIFKKVMEREK
jgi:hypothetical protein